MTCQSLCAPENTLTTAARQRLDSRAKALLLRLLFTRGLCMFGLMKTCIKAWFVCPLSGSHLYAFQAAITPSTLRYRTGRACEFSELGNKPSWEALASSSVAICKFAPACRYRGGTTCRERAALPLGLEEKVWPKPLEPLQWARARYFLWWETCDHSSNVLDRST
jgi:hypothetical protein